MEFKRHFTIKKIENKEIDVDGEADIQKIRIVTLEKERPENNAKRTKRRNRRVQNRRQRRSKDNELTNGTVRGGGI